jgi:uncharacterized protein
LVEGLVLVSDVEVVPAEEGAALAGTATVRAVPPMAASPITKVAAVPAMRDLIIGAPFVASLSAEREKDRARPSTKPQWSGTPPDIVVARGATAVRTVAALPLSDGRRILSAMDEPAPLANLITLGARDLPRLRDFYQALGWPQIIDDGEFVAFALRGIVLALFPLAQLARDGRTEAQPGTGGISFTIGINVDTAEEVDRLTERMRDAGARVTKEPVDAEFFTGRSAYLCDPEDNYFEIVWAESDNPVLAAVRRAAGV